MLDTGYWMLDEKSEFYLFEKDHVTQPVWFRLVWIRWSLSGERFKVDYLNFMIPDLNRVRAP